MKLLIKTPGEIVVGIGIAWLGYRAATNLFGRTMCTATILLGLAVIGLMFASRKEDWDRISSKVPWEAKVAILAMLVGLAYPQILNIGPILTKGFWGQLLELRVLALPTKTPFVAGVIVLAAGFILPAFLPRGTVWLCGWAGLLIMSFLLMAGRTVILTSIPMIEDQNINMVGVGEAIFLLLIYGLIGFMLLPRKDRPAQS